MTDPKLGYWRGTKLLVPFPHYHTQSNHIPDLSTLHFQDMSVKSSKSLPPSHTGCFTQHPAADDDGKHVCYWTSAKPCRPTNRMKRLISRFPSKNCLHMCHRIHSNHLFLVVKLDSFMVYCLKPFYSKVRSKQPLRNTHFDICHIVTRGNTNGQIRCN